jgi:hypothetical protein
MTNQEGSQRGSGCDLFRIMSQPFCEDIEENHEKA